MADEPSDDDDLRRAIQRQVETSRATGDIPFTQSAHDALDQRIADYANDLVEESSRVARRRHSPDIVSLTDVELAIEHLGVQPRKRRARMVGTVGSMLLGAALGNVLQIVGSPTVSGESAVLTFTFGTVGAALTVVGYMRD